MTDTLDRLRTYLQATPPGQVTDTEQIERLLRDCWDCFAGGDEASMHGGKLINRMENVQWQPPTLLFRIERHGATVLGSTRAEVWQWKINVNGLRADGRSVRQHQVEARDRPVRVEPIAEEVVTLVVAGKDDARLQWKNAERTRVRVVVANIPELDAASKQTREGRRRRFRDELVVCMRRAGWTRDPKSRGPSLHTYDRKSPTDKP